MQEKKEKAKEKREAKLREKQMKEPIKSTENEHFSRKWYKQKRDW